MAEELGTTVETTVDNNQYIEAIQQLKENTVDKEKYNKLQEENRRLLNTLVEGGSIKPETAQKCIDLGEATDSILFGNNTNMDYIRKVVDLRDELIRQGKPDPFLAQDPINGVPTQAAVERSNQVAEVFRECLEYADGDPSVFQSELQRRCIDPAISRMPR